MLILLAFILVIISVWMAVIKRTKESGYLVGLCLSLMLEICGIMFFIAKKGGVSSELVPLFYFSNNVKIRVQYLMITLNRLGYLVVLGRTLFPFFLIELALCYSMTGWIRKNRWLAGAVTVFPAFFFSIVSSRYLSDDYFTKTDLEHVYKLVCTRLDESVYFGGHSFIVT